MEVIKGKKGMKGSRPWRRKPSGPKYPHPDPPKKEEEEGSQPHPIRLKPLDPEGPLVIEEGSQVFWPEGDFNPDWPEGNSEPVDGP